MAGGLTGTPAPPSLSPPVGEALPSCTHKPTHPTTIPPDICQGKEGFPAEPSLSRPAPQWPVPCPWLGLVWPGGIFCLSASNLSLSQPHLDGASAT